MKSGAMTAVQTRRYRWSVLLRVVLAGAGGYAITALVCAAMAHGLVALGAMDRAQAVLLATLLSFVLYTALALWVFHVRSVWRVAVIQAASAALLGAVWLALKGWT